MWQHNNITTTVNIHRFSLIFTHFHSFSHVVITHFSLIIHMLSLLIFHRFSPFFTHFYSFFVVCCRLSRCRIFFRKFYLSWTPTRTLSLHFTHFLLSTLVFHRFSFIFTHFYSFSLSIHSFLLSIHSFLLVFTKYSLIFRCLLSVVTLSHFF